MVSFNVLFCLLGVPVLQGLANPIAIQSRSMNPETVAYSRNPQVQSTTGKGHQITSSTSSALYHKHTTSPSITASTTTCTTTSISTTTLKTGPSSVSQSGASVPLFDNSHPFAVAYSPYTSSGGCKDISAICSDLEIIAANGFQCIRLYGTDCNQVSNVLSVMELTGISLQLFLGVYDLDNAISETSSLISAIGGQWSNVITISVGNEPVNSGQASVSTVISTTSSVRSQLRAAGYTGPVVAVDTFIAILNNPGLCDASDYIAANAHAYFDGGVSASGAGAWVAQQASKLSSLCGGKDVLITESGWPSAGDSNGQAVASKANQDIAMAGIMSSMGNKCILFSAFDDDWKSPGQYGVEQHWVENLSLTT